jgi:hypothetical protein
MVTLGRDYEVASEFKTFFLSHTFVGCTGYVSYADGTNDRAAINYDLQNM